MHILLFFIILLLHRRTWRSVSNDGKVGHIHSNQRWPSAWWWWWWWRQWLEWWWFGIYRTNAITLTDVKKTLVKYISLVVHHLLYCECWGWWMSHFTLEGECWMSYNLFFRFTLLVELPCSAETVIWDIILLALFNIWTEAIFYGSSQHENLDWAFTIWRVLFVFLVFICSLSDSSRCRVSE